MKTSALASLVLLSVLPPGTLRASDSSAIRAPLIGTGAPAATGLVIATLSARRSELIVQASHLAPSHNYDVEVAGIVEASVTADPAGRAKIRFRTPAQKNVPLLDFDPRGAVLRFLDSGTSELEGVLSGAGEDSHTQIDERVTLAPAAAPIAARAKARFTEDRQGRRHFRVDVSGVAGSTVQVLVGGVPRGDVTLHRKSGTLLFDSAPASAKVDLLDFDPRGETVDLTSDGEVLFSSPMDAQVPGVNVASPSLSEVALTAEPAAAGGTATARLRVDERARRHFSAEVEGVPAGNYDLLVDGAIVATLPVVAVTAGTSGEVEFATDDNDPKEQPLTFDPTGKTISIKQGDVLFFDGTLGAAPNPNGAPPAGAPSQIEETLTSTGLDPHARGDAKFIVDDQGRRRFSVEIEDAAAGTYRVSVAGIVRGTLSAQATVNGVKGELEFSTGESRHTAKGGGGDAAGGAAELPLTFDPRGQLIEVSSEAGVLFSHLFGSGSAGAPGSEVPSSETQLALIRADGVTKGEAKMEYRQRADGSRRFEVQAEDLAAGAYDVLVSGTVRGSLTVASTADGLRGEIEFETNAEGSELPLDFPVLGQEVLLQQGGVTLFSRTVPTP